jgi:glycosyltransferase involved in cell wall biosynthesis
MPLITKQRLAFFARMARGRVGAAADRSCPHCGYRRSSLLGRRKLVLHARRCRACGLIFRWPKDTADFNADFYQDDYEQSGLTTGLPDDATLRELLRSNFAGSEKDYSHKVALLQRLRPSGRVLDFGCSWGYYDAAGFEISRPRARYGRDRLALEIMDDPRVLDALPEGSFDAIVSNHVLEHFPSLSGVFERFYRLLKDDGLLLLWLPNGAGATARRMGLEWGASISEKHTLLFTPEFFAGALQPRGFRTDVFTSDDSVEYVADHCGERHVSGSTGDELVVVGTKDPAGPLPRVYLANTGMKRLFDIAVSLQDRGLLARFVTGPFFTEQDRLIRVLDRLPAPRARAVRRELLRRSHPRLDPGRVSTFSPPEWAFILAGKTPALKTRIKHVTRLRNELFDRHVARMVRRDRPDLVMVQDTMGRRTIAAAKEAGTVSLMEQCIGHVHTSRRILAEEARLHPEFGLDVARMIPEWVMERCTWEALHADHILAPSAYVRDTLMEIGVDRDRVTVIPYGVDTDFFRPAERRRQGRLQILFVGQIAPRKGLVYLFEAFKGMDCSDVELVLVGKKLHPTDWLRPYEHLFRHVPHVPHGELQELFNQADVFVYPSLHEGSACAIMEAMASGLPVVTTHNSGSLARDGEEGFIVPLRDPDTLRQRLETLCRDASLRGTMGTAARKRVEGYSWAHFQQELAALIHRLTTGQPPSQP